MRIYLCSIIVSDQEKALLFYTRVLGFVKAVDLPAGEFRWLTVVSERDSNGVQLVLEPNVNPAALKYQRALFESGIPLTSFAVDDMDEEYESLKSRGVEFTMMPTSAGDSRIAIFNDTCGNLIQIHEAQGNAG